MYLDPRDETGMNIDNILFRSALNTSTIPAAQPWQWKLWTRGERFELGFICTSCVIEIRARDSAGNLSPIQKRYFASPFPYSPAPNLKPSMEPFFRMSGPTADLRGLFINDFTGDGFNSVVQVDRATGDIKMHRSRNGFSDLKSDVVLSLGANSIVDSVCDDFDGDGRADLIVANTGAGALGLYHNDGPDGNGVVQFSFAVLSLSQTGITSVTHMTLGDITDEGKPDVIVSGTDANGDPVLGWLIHDAIWNFNAANATTFPQGPHPASCAWPI